MLDQTELHGNLGTHTTFAAWTSFLLRFPAEEASRRLAAVGFQKLSEKQEWKLKPGGRYYFTRNLSTIVAFAVGAKYQPGNGLHMIGAHTDRCCTSLSYAYSSPAGLLTLCLVDMHVP